MAERNWFTTAGDDELVPQTGGPSESLFTIGEVAPDDEEALYETDETGIFTDYYVVNRYENDQRRWMLGVTSPDGFQGDSVAFVQLANRTTLLICDWTAEKIGSQPAIPKLEPADDNLVPLDDHLEPSMKELGAGGAEEDIIYRISGTYIYGFKNPSAVQYCTPQPPWMQPGAGECTVSPGLEQEGIMCCEESSASTGGASPGNPGSNTPTNPSEVGSFPQD